MEEFDKADWNSINTAQFCKICVEEIDAGNRPNGTMNNRGYASMAVKYFQKTGLRHSRIQLKNRWDGLKGLWNFWLRINKDTGLGYDEARQTVVASDEWWRNNIKVYS